jgi:saccharopine dehydrogenase-like NADP-dependent oxidoreductase
MRNVLIIGAGRSSNALINYMLEAAQTHNWLVTVADADLQLAQDKTGNHPKSKAVALDALDPSARAALVANADIVISLLPPNLHTEVAFDCLRLNKHLITASYVSKEINDLHEDARRKGLLFMGEMGLDPGIDHMSALQSIHWIEHQGGKLQAFRSYTGGLIAPESDTNPWHYKFSWNPRNVVLAGQATAQYFEDARLKCIPYNRLFKSYNVVHVPGMGNFEAYANRDSLLYRSLYGLNEIPTILRGTLRYRGFCDAWNALVQIGLTDNACHIKDCGQMTYRDLVEAFISDKYPGNNLEARTASFLGLEEDCEIMDKLSWLGLFNEERIPIQNGSPALILEQLLLSKWELGPADKDMVIMQHEFEYLLNDTLQVMTATMVMKGNSPRDTAMARLVGLPMGILAKGMLQGKIQLTGVRIPVMPEVYTPVLAELRDYGVVFEEQQHTKQ